MDSEPVTIRVLFEGEDPEHRAVCPQCGQDIDRRDLMDIFHHRQPAHEPLPLH